MRPCDLTPHLSIRLHHRPCCQSPDLQVLLQLHLHLHPGPIITSPTAAQQHGSNLNNIFSQPEQRGKRKLTSTPDRHRHRHLHLHLHLHRVSSGQSLPHPKSTKLPRCQRQPHLRPRLADASIVDSKTSDFVSAPRNRGIAPARPGASLLTAVGRTHLQLRHATVVDRLTQNSSWALPLRCMHSTWG